MSSYPHIYLAKAAAEQQGVKSLVDIAIDACIQNRHRLGKRVGRTPCLSERGRVCDSYAELQGRRPDDCATLL